MSRSPPSPGCGRRVREPDAPDGGRILFPTATQPRCARPLDRRVEHRADPWQSYEAGLQQARTQKKPVCLVFSTTWCPHCKNFSHVFDDPRVVAHARDFVMIHLDADAEEAIASKYALDGSYIPRTFFLGPDGKVDFATIHAPRLASRFFYDEHDPGSLLAAMDGEAKAVRPELTRAPAATLHVGAAAPERRVAARVPLVVARVAASGPIELTQRLPARGVRTPENAGIARVASRGARSCRPDPSAPGTRCCSRR